MTQSVEATPGARSAAPGTAPVTVAVMGEFSSGKSSLINLLLNQPLLPTQVTATQIPAVLLRHGAERTASALTRDGTVEDLGEIDPFSLDYQSYALVRAQFPVPVLEHISIIDTPGISDPLLEKSAVAELAELSDMVLWCTHATQAWRESENGFWRAMPKRLHETSTLVVTRSDLLSEADLARVRNRLVTETEGLFKHLVFLSTPMAAAALEGDDPAGDRWRQSGARSLLNALGLERRDLLGRAPAPPPGPAVSESSEDRPQWWDLVAVEDKKTQQDHILALVRYYRAKHAQLDDGMAEGSVGIPQLAAVMHADLAEEAERHGAEERPMKRLRQLVNSVALKVAKSKSAPGDDTPDATVTVKEIDMSLDISGLNQIDGFIGACLADTETGLMLASEGGANFDLEAAAAGNTEVVKAKLKVMTQLNLNDKIEDILITLGTQYHLFRLLEDTPTVFIYVALDKRTANLGMARIQVKKVEATLSL